MTNSEFITEVMRLAGIVSEGVPLTAEQVLDGISMLNDMLADWSADSIDVGYFQQSDPAAENPIYADAMSAVKHNFAIRLCGHYGQEPPIAVVAVAQRGYERLERDAVSAAMKEADLTHLPGASNRWDIEGG